MMIEGIISNINSIQQPTSNIGGSNMAAIVDEVGKSESIIPNPIPFHGGISNKGNQLPVKLSTSVFQHSPRIGFVSPSLSNLGSGLYSSIVLHLPILGLTDASLQTLCLSVGLKAEREISSINGQCTLPSSQTTVNSTLKSNDGIAFDNSKIGVSNSFELDLSKTDESIIRRRSSSCPPMLHDKFVSNPSISKVTDGTTDATSVKKSSHGALPVSPSSKKVKLTNVYNVWNDISNNPLNVETMRFRISNKGCMGLTEIQLTQKVIDGAASIVEIEKKIADGAGIENFLLQSSTPPLPPPPFNVLQEARKKIEEAKSNYVSTEALVKSDSGYFVGGEIL